jgi:hypothetical protein
MLRVQVGPVVYEDTSYLVVEITGINCLVG